MNIALGVRPYIGVTKDIGRGLFSAIDKRPVTEPLWLSLIGLAGDEQADTRVHGGPERAVHHYPAEHYAFWRGNYPGLAWDAPTFGENLSTVGIDEHDLCIGDLFRWGTALLQVSQPRSPCYRLQARWHAPALAALMQRSGRCGWFYRVLEAGRAGPADILWREHRDTYRLSVAEALASYFHTPLARAGLERLAACPALSPRWRDTARKRLHNGRLEDWRPRLEGPQP